MSMMRRAKGVPITIIKDGKINVINGTVISDGEARRAFFEAHQTLGSHLGRHGSQRSGKWCSEPDRLVERSNDAAQARNTRPLRQIVERLITDGGDAHLCACSCELLSNLGIGGAENAGDLVDRVVQAETRLSADNEQIERIGDTSFQTHAPPRR